LKLVAKAIGSLFQMMDFLLPAFYCHLGVFSLLQYIVETICTFCI